MNNRKKKIIIAELNNECNNSCFFCKVDKTGSRGSSFLIEQIKNAARAGFKAMDLTGSETTLNPNFFDYISTARACGFNLITVFTNGGMFYYESFCRKASASGITKIIFGAHSSRLKLHDSITQRPGSFSQLLAAMNNVKKYGMQFGVQLPLHTKNIEGVRQTVVFLKRQGADFFIFTPVLPSLYQFRESLDLDTRLLLRPRHIKMFKKELLKLKGFNFSFNFFPPCRLRGIDRKFIKSNIGLKNVMVVSENGNIASAERLIKRITSRKVKCALCPDKARCEGELNNIAPLETHSFFWCLSDLHVQRSTFSRSSSIFRDAKNLEWNKALLLGDIVEGDKGRGAFSAYRNLSAKFSLGRRVLNLAGNHDYCFENDEPSLSLFKKNVSKRLFRTYAHGNILFILLSLDQEPGDIAGCPPDSILNETFNKLKKALTENSGMITIVASHYNMRLTRVGRSGASLKDLLPGRAMPDVWVSGHSSFEDSRLLTSSRGTKFINCPQAAHDIKSLFFVFQDRTPFITIKIRDHKGRGFIPPEIRVKLRKNIKLRQGHNLA
ncbi:MAG TPA: hypothetical protein DCL35_02575 [Candidatus Omnitrophica bacterium]|nr:hypothetical protein [Candidatus Omnitrophota bacterium]